MLAILLLSLFWCLPAVQAEKNSSGKTFYTIANIWYERPEKIYSTNYHKGTILPVGTKVTIKKISGKEIAFSNDSGMDFRILYVKKHSPGVSVEDHVDRYFSEKDPMGAGGVFKKFTKKEQDSIKAGTIEEGMSRDAVLMSYGYPPPVKTSTLNSDQWIYMENKFVSRAVQFKDGKVSSTGR